VFRLLPWGPGIKPGSKNHDIVGGLDFMATFVALAAVNYRTRTGKPIISDSFDMSPVLSAREM
jgi:arylsulfatase